MSQYPKILTAMNLGEFTINTKKIGRISSRNQIFLELDKAHQTEYEAIRSSELAITFKSFIKSTPNYVRKSPVFVAEIERKLLCLHEYNLKVAKCQGNKYPLRPLYKLLILYVELECELLYRTTEPVPVQKEDEVEKRVLKVLHVILNDAIQKNDVPINTTRDICLKIILKVLVGVRRDIVEKNNVIDNAIVKIVDQIGCLDEVNEFIENNSVIYLDEFFQEPEAMELRRKLTTSDYDSGSFDSDDTEDFTDSSDEWDNETPKYVKHLPLIPIKEEKTDLCVSPPSDSGGDDGNPNSNLPVGDDGCGVQLLEEGSKNGQAGAISLRSVGETGHEQTGAIVTIEILDDDDDDYDYNQQNNNSITSSELPAVVDIKVENDDSASPNSVSGGDGDGGGFGTDNELTIPNSDDSSNNFPNTNDSCGNRDQSEENEVVASKEIIHEVDCDQIEETEESNLLVLEDPLKVIFEDVSEDEAQEDHPDEELVNSEDNLQVQDMELEESPKTSQVFERCPNNQEEDQSLEEIVKDLEQLTDDGQAQEITQPAIVENVIEPVEALEETVDIYNELEKDSVGITVNNNDEEIVMNTNPEVSLEDENVVIKSSVGNVEEPVISEKGESEGTEKSSVQPSIDETSEQIEEKPLNCEPVVDPKSPEQELEPIQVNCSEEKTKDIVQEADVSLVETTAPSTPISVLQEIRDSPPTTDALYYGSGVSSAAGSAVNEGALGFLADVASNRKILDVKNDTSVYSQLDEYTLNCLYKKADESDPNASEDDSKLLVIDETPRTRKSKVRMGIVKRNQRQTNSRLTRNRANNRVKPEPITPISVEEEIKEAITPSKVAENKFTPNDFITLQSSTTSTPTNNVYAQKRVSEANPISEDSNDSCENSLVIDEGCGKSSDKFFVPPVYDEDTIDDDLQFFSNDVDPKITCISIPETEHDNTSAFQNFHILKQMEEFVGDQDEDVVLNLSRTTADEPANVPVEVTTSKQTDHSIERLLNTLTTTSENFVDKIRSNFENNIKEKLMESINSTEEVNPIDLTVKKNVVIPPLSVEEDSIIDECTTNLKVDQVDESQEPPFKSKGALKSFDKANDKVDNNAKGTINIPRVRSTSVNVGEGKIGHNLDIDYLDLDPFLRKLVKVKPPDCESSTVGGNCDAENEEEVDSPLDSSKESAQSIEEQVISEQVVSITADANSDPEIPSPIEEVISSEQMENDSVEEPINSEQSTEEAVEVNSATELFLDETEHVESVQTEVPVPEPTPVEVVGLAEMSATDGFVEPEKLVTDVQSNDNFEQPKHSSEAEDVEIVTESVGAKINLDLPPVLIQQEPIPVVPKTPGTSDSDQPPQLERQIEPVKVPTSLDLSQSENVSDADISTYPFNSMPPIIVTSPVKEKPTTKPIERITRSRTASEKHTKTSLENTIKKIKERVQKSKSDSMSPSENTSISEENVTVVDKNDGRLSRFKSYSSDESRSRSERSRRKDHRRSLSKTRSSDTHGRKIDSGSDREKSKSLEKNIRVNHHHVSRDNKSKTVDSQENKNHSTSSDKAKSSSFEREKSPGSKSSSRVEKSNDSLRSKQTNSTKSRHEVEKEIEPIDESTIIDKTKRHDRKSRSESESKDRKAKDTEISFKDEKKSESTRHKDSKPDRDRDRKKEEKKPIEDLKSEKTPKSRKRSRSREKYNDDRNSHRRNRSYSKESTGHKSDSDRGRKSRRKSERLSRSQSDAKIKLENVNQDKSKHIIDKNEKPDEKGVPVVAEEPKSVIDGRNEVKEDEKPVMSDPVPRKRTHGNEHHSSSKRRKQNNTGQVPLIPDDSKTGAPPLISEAPDMSAPNSEPTPLGTEDPIVTSPEESVSMEVEGAEPHGTDFNSDQGYESVTSQSVNTPASVGSQHKTPTRDDEIAMNNEQEICTVQSDFPAKSHETMARTTATSLVTCSANLAESPTKMFCSVTAESVSVVNASCSTVIRQDKTCLSFAFSSRADDDRVDPSVMQETSPRKFSGDHLISHADLGELDMATSKTDYCEGDQIVAGPLFSGNQEVEDDDLLSRELKGCVPETDGGTASNINNMGTFSQFDELPFKDTDFDQDEFMNESGAIHYQEIGATDLDSEELLKGLEKSLDEITQEEMGKSHLNNCHGESVQRDDSIKDITSEDDLPDENYSIYAMAKILSLNKRNTFKSDNSTPLESSYTETTAVPTSLSSSTIPDGDLIQKASNQKVVVEPVEQCQITSIEDRKTVDRADLICNKDETDPTVIARNDFIPIATNQKVTSPVPHSSKSVQLDMEVLFKQNNNKNSQRKSTKSPQSVEINDDNLVGTNNNETNDAAADSPKRSSLSSDGQKESPIANNHNSADKKRKRIESDKLFDELKRKPPVNRDFIDNNTPKTRVAYVTQPQVKRVHVNDRTSFMVGSVQPKAPIEVRKPDYSNRNHGYRGRHGSGRGGKDPKWRPVNGVSGGREHHRTNQRPQSSSFSLNSGYVHPADRRLSHAEMTNLASTTRLSVPNPKLSDDHAWREKLEGVIDTRGDLF